MSQTYSFLDVTAALVGPGGAINLGAGAAAANEGITVESTGDANTMTVGADGAAMHSLNGDRSGTVTVTLLQTSPVNSQLQALFNFQRGSAATHGQNTLVITDKARGDVISCQQVAFQRQPSLGYGKDAGTRVWTFAAGRIDPALGGLV